jgi:hypothetical protein
LTKNSPFSQETFTKRLLSQKQPILLWRLIVHRGIFLAKFLISTLMVSALILMSTLSFGTVKASTTVTGIINSDTTWTKANSPYNLTGNVLVNNEVTLTIQSGVSVNLNGYYIMVNGTLCARGISAEPIAINGGELTFTQFSADWNESTATGCIIENAIITAPSLSSLNSIKISNSNINAQVSVERFSVITNNVITQKVTVSGFSVLSNNDIKAEVSVSGSSVASNNAIIGAVRADGSTVISNNTITNPDAYGGTGLTCLGYAFASQNVISGWSSGVEMDSQFFANGGRPVVENNFILNNTIGIGVAVLRRDWVGTLIPTIQNNLISNNTKGIMLSIGLQEAYGDNPPTTIQNNTISQNTIGIELAGSVDPNYCVIQYNNIQDNSNYNIYLGGSSCNAAYNWWGTTDTQAINQTIYDFKNDFNLGTVTFVPFLTEPNSQAMPYPNASISIPVASSSPSPSPTSSASASPTPVPTPSPTSSQSPTATPVSPQTGLSGTETAIIIALIVIASIQAVTLALVLKKKR